MLKKKIYCICKTFLYINLIVTTQKKSRTETNNKNKTITTKGNTGKQS